MRLLRGMMCFLVVVLLMSVFVGQSPAELPQMREIKDKIRWGDPDELGGCRKNDSRSWRFDNPPDCEMLRADGAQTVERLCMELLWVRLRVSLQKDIEYPKHLSMHSLYSAGR